MGVIKFYRDLWKKTHLNFGKANSLNNVRYLGRLGDYRYYDLDKEILRTIEFSEEIK